MSEHEPGVYERSNYGLISRLYKGRVMLAGAGVEVVGAAASVAANNTSPLFATTMIGLMWAGEVIHDLQNNRNHERENLNVLTRWMVRRDEEVLAQRQSETQQLI